MCQLLLKKFDATPDTINISINIKCVHRKHSLYKHILLKGVRNLTQNMFKSNQIKLFITEEKTNYK